ncbi:MAG: hypothetical protein ACTSWY_07540, partial [Promethearchaeota archaeon]
MTNISQSEEKLKKITEILWKYWWFVFYIIILPVGISLIISSVVIPYLGLPIEFSYSIFFLTIVPLIILFIIPFDRYWKTGFFKKSKYPQEKHLWIYFIASIFPLLYTLILNIPFGPTGENFTTFFSETGIFLKIIHPIFSLLGLFYYFITREFPQKSWTLKDIQNRTIERIVIIFNFIIRSSFVVFFFPMAASVIMLVTDIFGFVICILFYKIKISLKSDLTQDQEFYSSVTDENKSDNGTEPIGIPQDIKIRIFFNLFPIIHLVILGFGLLFYMGLEEFNIMQFIILAIVAFSLCVKSVYFVFHYELKKTPHIKILISSPKTHRNCAWTSIILSVCCIIIFFDPYLMIFSILFLFLLTIITYVEGKKELISGKFFAYFITSSTLAFITFFSFVFNFFGLDIYYCVIIFTISFYIDIELLSRFGVISKEKTSVFQAILFPVIIMEIFINIAHLCIYSLLSLYPPLDPISEFLFGFEIYCIAFLVSCIFSLIYTYVSRLKRRTNKYLKNSLLILHIALVLNIMGLYSFDIGGLLTNFSPEFSFFTYYLVPLLIFSIITLFVFNVYYSMRIYSKDEFLKIGLFGIDIISILTGLSITNLFQTLNSVILASFIITLSLMTHQYVNYQKGILKDKDVYIKRSNFLSFLLFFEVDFTIFLILFEYFLVSIPFAIIITSIFSMVILKIIPKGRIFTYRFSRLHNICNLFIQLVSMAIYQIFISVDSQFTNSILFLPVFLSISIYSSIIFSYGIKFGIFFRDIHVRLTNLSFFALYSSVSLIPAYIGNITVNISTNNAPFFTLFSFFLTFTILYFIDHRIIHGLFNGPKIWISNAIRRSYIDIKTGLNVEKNKRILKNTLQLWIPEGVSQEESMNVKEQANNILKSYSSSGNNLNVILFQESRIQQLIHHFGWIISLFAIIFSYIYIITSNLPLVNSFSIAFPLSGIIAISLIKNLRSANIVSKTELENILNGLTILFLDFAFSFTLFVITAGNIILLIILQFAIIIFSNSFLVRRFSKRFTQIFNMFTLILQSIFVSIFLSSLTGVFFAAKENIYLQFLSQIPIFLILTFYLIIILSYAIKRGFLFKKTYVWIANSLFFALYSFISFIPSFILQILYEKGITVPLPWEIFNTFYSLLTFFSTLTVLYLIDIFVLHGMSKTPKVWILNAIKKNYINIDLGPKAEKNKKIITETIQILKEIEDYQENDINPVDSITSGIDPSKMQFQDDFIHYLFYHFGWITSLLAITFSFIFFIGYISPLEISFAFILPLSSIFAINFIRNLRYSKVIGKNRTKKLRILNIIFLILSFSFMIFEISKSISSRFLSITAAFSLSLELAFIFIFGMFWLFRNKLIKLNLKVYYFTVSNISLILSVLTAIFLVSLLREMITFSNNTFFDNLIFLNLVVVLGLIFSNRTINFLKEYNKKVLEDVNIESYFEEQQSQHEQFLLNAKQMAKNGISDAKTEIILSVKIPIAKTYSIQRTFYYLLYISIPLLPFLFTISLGMWFESIVIYFGILLALFLIEKKLIKKISLDKTNIEIFRIWAIFQVLISLNISFLIETSNILGQILCFSLCLSVCMQVMNYFMIKANIKIKKWNPIRDIVTQICIAITSTAYLIYTGLISIYGTVNSFEIVIIIVLSIIQCSFFWSYITKFPSQPRFFRTFIFSFPTLYLSLYLMRFYSLFFWAPLLSTIMIVFSYFYYYSIIPKESDLLNSIYQWLIIGVGFLFVDNFLSTPWTLLVGSPNFMEIQRVFLSLGITLLLHYYIRKRAFFNIYESFIESNVRIKGIGFFGALGRAIGLYALPYALYALFSFKFGLRITMFATGTSFPKGLFGLTLSGVEFIFPFGFQLYLAVFSLYHFFSSYIQNDKLAYKVCFALKILEILSLTLSFGVVVYLYEEVFLIILPIILIICYRVLIKFQKENPYRANNTIGIAKSYLVYIFSYWILQKFVFNLLIPAISSINPTIGVYLEPLKDFLGLSFSIGITGYVFSITMRYISYKLRRIIIPAELSVAIVFICIGFAIMLNPIVSFDFIFSILITLDLGILLLYLAIGFYYRKFSKRIWTAGWWLWLALPIINFNLIWRALSGLDSISLNLFNIPGSLLFTIIIFTVLYFPVILYKFKNFYKYAFLITWGESIFLWIWLSQNLFQALYFNPILSPLFILGLTMISLLPLLYQLKFWKSVAIGWAIIAISNATFLSFFIPVSFMSGILDDILMYISINIVVYGLFFMIFFYNPAVKEWLKEKGKNRDLGLIIGFILMFIGLAFILYGVFFLVINDHIFAINVAGITIGILLISGKTMEILKKKLNRYIIVLIAVNLGSLIFWSFYKLEAFMITLPSDYSFLQLLFNINLFAVSLGLTFACGIMLISQSRSYISKKNWRVFYYIMSIAIGQCFATMFQSLFYSSMSELLNFYVGTFLFFSILVSYPALKSKISFWLSLPISISFFTQELLSHIFIFFMGDFTSQIFGLDVCLYLVSYSLILGITLNFAVSFYKQLKSRSEILLQDLGILTENLDFINNMPETKQVIFEKITLQEEIKTAKRALKSIERIPEIFLKPKNLTYIFSSVMGSSLYLLTFIFCQLIADPFIRIPVFLFTIAVSNFIILKYNKNSKIFQHELFLNFSKTISGIMLYFSIGFGFSLISIYSISFTILADSPLEILLDISFVSLIFYLTLFIFENRINLYKNTVNTSFKILFWTLFMISFAIFISVIIGNPFFFFIVLTISGYNLKNHLLILYGLYSTNAEFLVDLSNLPPLSIQPKKESIESDISPEMRPPGQLNIDVSEIKNSMDEIFSESEKEPSDTSLQENINRFIAHPSKQQEISQKMTLIKKKQIRLEQLKKFISYFDVLLRQTFILEITYAISLIIVILLPKFNWFLEPFDFISMIFIFTFVLTLFYNFTEIIPKRFRLKISLVVLCLLFINSILMPIFIFMNYGVELRFIVGNKINAPNTTFLASCTILLLLLETLLIIRNYASTKNIHIERAIIDKSESIIHPALLLLVAFTIANLFSYNLNIITRLTIASFILFIEIIADEYILKWYNRYIRSRILVYSWVLFSILIVVQIILLIPLCQGAVFSISSLTGLIFILMQFLTVYFKFNQKNEAIIRKFNRDKEILEGNRTAIDNKESEYELLRFSDYRSRKYNILGILLLGIFGVLITALFYNFGGLHSS